VIHWYICPFDVTFRGSQLLRKPAILRHIQNTAGQPQVCAWIQILNNRCLVKANVGDATHAVILADADFREVPNVGSLTVAQRNALRTFLETHGYTTTEINAAGLSRDALLQLIASVRCEAVANATGDGIEIKTVRRDATTPFSIFSKVSG
jgi:hypothetical protein